MALQSIVDLRLISDLLPVNSVFSLLFQVFNFVSFNILLYHIPLVIFLHGPKFSPQFSPPM